MSKSTRADNPNSFGQTSFSFQ